MQAEARVQRCINRDGGEHPRNDFLQCVVADKGNEMRAARRGDERARDREPEPRSPHQSGARVAEDGEAGAAGGLKFVRAQCHLRRQPAGQQRGHCDESATARDGINEPSRQSGEEEEGEGG